MINTARIQELKDEVGEDDLFEVIELFCEEVEEVLDILDASSQNEFLAQLHFLKGSALNIGLDAVSELCKTEEVRLKSDPSAPPNIGAIRSAFSDAKKALLKPGTNRPQSRLLT